MPVQWVIARIVTSRICRFDSSGVVSPGDRVRVLPSGTESVVKQIVTYEGDLELAGAGRGVHSLSKTK